MIRHLVYGPWGTFEIQNTTSIIAIFSLIFSLKMVTLSTSSQNNFFDLYFHCTRLPWGKGSSLKRKVVPGSLASFDDNHFILFTD